MSATTIIQNNVSPSEEIRAISKRLNDNLVIMGHHYQLESVIRHASMRGDSLELARKTSTIEAENIVFCGVHFMGESSALLARKGQKVYLPAPDAQCVMAQTSPAPLVEHVLQRLNADGRRVIPLTYVNSSVAVKAVAGKFGGSVCTSANAEKMLRWAQSQGDAVLFLPDKNLGQNTADTLGIAASARHILNITNSGKNMDENAARKASLLFWPGCCAIHTKFTPQSIAALRAKYPSISIVIHPECSPAAVSAADAAGSTSFIIRHVANAPEGAVIGIGTEENLVIRLAAEYRGRKTIVPIAVSGCSNMAKVTEEKLLQTLRAIENGTAQPVRVADELQDNARLALTRMLEACA